MKAGVFALLLFSGIAAAAPGSGCGGAQAAQGLAWFGETDFRRAATGFAGAIEANPDCAEAHFWLGRSLVRRYESSSPLFGGRRLRKARVELERALQLQPDRADYALEMAQFYLDNPDSFRGGLDRAAEVLTLVPAGDFAAEDLRLRLDHTRSERRSHGRIRRALIWLTAQGRYGMSCL
jgi:hypothetical protein